LSVPRCSSAWAAILSNIVSNVPAVLVFKPIVTHLPDPLHAWLVLAMSSTLAGNLTVLGSVANLIVVERARREAHISFWEYAKVGIPVTVVSWQSGSCCYSGSGGCGRKDYRPTSRIAISGNLLESSAICQV
jgi:di/tricarboxylate transporter